MNENQECMDKSMPTTNKTITNKTITNKTITIFPEEVILHIFSFSTLKENLITWSRLNKEYSTLLDDKIYHAQITRFDCNSGSWKILPSINYDFIFPRIIYDPLYYNFVDDIHHKRHTYIVTKFKLASKDNLSRIEYYQLLYLKYWFSSVNYIDLSPFSLYVGPDSLWFLISSILCDNFDRVCDGKDNSTCPDRSNKNKNILYLNISNCYKFGINYSAILIVLLLALGLEELILANICNIVDVIEEITDICTDGNKFNKIFAHFVEANIINHVGDVDDKGVKDTIDKDVKDTIDKDVKDIIDKDVKDTIDKDDKSASDKHNHIEDKESRNIKNELMNDNLIVDNSMDALIFYPSFKPIITFPSLKKLDLSKNKGLNWNILYDLLLLFPCLTSINLSCVNLRNINFHGLECSKTLENINVSGNDYLYNHDVINGIIKSCTSLRQINVVKSFCEDSIHIPRELVQHPREN